MSNQTNKTASEILDSIRLRKEKAATIRLREGTELQKILLKTNPMPAKLWNDSIASLLSVGFFGVDGKPTQRPNRMDEVLIMEKDGYGISTDQTKAFDDAVATRSGRVEKNSDVLRKGVTAFANTRDCEVKSLTFNAGVTGKKARLDVSMTATPTKTTIKKLTI